MSIATMLETATKISPLNVPARPVVDESYTIQGVRVVDIQPNQIQQGDVIVERGTRKASLTEVKSVDLAGCSAPNSTHVNGNNCYDGTAPVAIAIG